MSAVPYFDQGSGTVRFQVHVGGEYVSASIGRAILHYRYNPSSVSDEPLTTYHQHSAEIHEAVRRRLSAGSREPVMLRDGDVRAAPTV